MSAKRDDKRAAWPDASPGEPVAPAFLTHVDGGTLDFELLLNLLGAYGIPTLTQYPNNGVLGKVIAGFPGGGVDIYVPETRLEEARDILDADAVPDGDHAEL
ncbi:MAG: hypothetical protein LBD92_03590 [Oscillospiraceae bacterium]|jgi:hypothetical protein|nr:hypothetical protein [Oscillospiraceae bacterium]